MVALLNRLSLGRSVCRDSAPASFLLADEVPSEIGTEGRDATLSDPFVSEEEETRKPARTRAIESLAEKIPAGTADDVPMRRRRSRNLSVRS